MNKRGNGVDMNIDRVTRRSAAPAEVSNSIAQKAPKKRSSLRVMTGPSQWAGMRSPSDRWRSTEGGHGATPTTLLNCLEPLHQALFKRDKVLSQSVLKTERMMEDHVMAMAGLDDHTTHAPSMAVLKSLESELATSVAEQDAVREQIGTVLSVVKKQVCNEEQHQIAQTQHAFIHQVEMQRISDKQAKWLADFKRARAQAAHGDALGQRQRHSDLRKLKAEHKSHLAEIRGETKKLITTIEADAQVEVTRIKTACAEEILILEKNCADIINRLPEQQLFMEAKIQQRAHAYAVRQAQNRAAEQLYSAQLRARRQIERAYAAAADESR